MWPFKKPDTRPRILLLDVWRSDGGVDFSIRRVNKIEGYFTMSKYSDSEVYILQPDGTFRDNTKMRWEMIDEIPGLITKASQAFAKSHPASSTDITAAHAAR